MKYCSQGFNPYCKSCKKKIREEYEKQIPDWKKHERGKNHYKKHKETIKRRVREFYKSERGKKLKTIQEAKRRKLGFFALFENPFTEEIEVHYHHINDLIVIPIPKITHLRHNGKNHRERCNKFIEKIYMIKLEEIVC